MHIKHAIWTAGNSPTPLAHDRLLRKQNLEYMNVTDWMLIGRQEPTPFGRCIDLLTIAPDASLVSTGTCEHGCP